MKKILILLLSVCLAISSLAHEYVLLAYKYIVKKGDLLEMHLFVSDGFNIELERPLQKNITKKFELITENGKTNLLSLTKDNALPIVDIKVDFKGLGLIHMERDYAKITLPNTKFLEYLKEDHIENISIGGSAKTEQTERYTRYVKALVQSDRNKNDSLYKTVAGQTFEIVLLDNPYLLKKGQSLKAKILFRSKPLPNKVITARNRKGNEPAIAQYSRTDKNGICYFRLKREGDWFIHATHMIPCPDKEDADWESFWTTFSFGLVQEE